MRGKGNQLKPTPAPNPLSSLFASNPTLSALLQSNPSLFSSLGSNPALSSLLRSGAYSRTSTSRQLDLASLLPLLTSSSSSGGTSSATTNLLLSSLMGGQSTSRPSGTTGLLLSALSGGSAGLTGTVFPKLSAAALSNLKSTCQTKGCCWAENVANRLGGTCYKKGT